MKHYTTMIKQRAFISICFLFFFVSLLRAGTRIKTTEWNFGSNSDPTFLEASTTWTPPTITVYLPESSKTIRNAFLEVEFMGINANDLTDITINFDQGSAASTTRDIITSLYHDPTGENNPAAAMVDVTSVISTAASQTYTASVAFAGFRTNTISLKLYITYEYDDTSATQIRTVRYPLYSAANVCSCTSEASEMGTYSFSYNADIAESGITVRQQWFEVRGLRRYGSNDHHGEISVNIGGGTASTIMYMRSDRETSFDFRYLDDPSDSLPAGFSLNTDQTLNVVTGNEDSSPDPAHMMLGGECLVTYEYTQSSSSKTKTVRIFLGQEESADAGAVFSTNLFLNESDITIKALYAEIVGSYNSDTGNYIVIDSSVNAQDITQRSYYVRAQTPNTSGFVMFHDLSQKMSSWTNGSSVGLQIGSLTGLGACGASLIVTYEYSGEDAYTEHYLAMTGQSASGDLTSTNQTFSTWFPGTYTKTLRSFFTWLYFNENEDENANSVTADPSTTVDLDGSNSITVQHRTQNQGHRGYMLYGNQGQVSTNTASATVNFSISVEQTALSGKYFNTFTCIPPPDDPASLAQYKSNGTTEISTGSWTNESTVVLKFSMTSPSVSDDLTPEIELRPIGTSFTDTVTHSGTEQSYAGSPLTGVITVAGLSDGTSYHWQARINGDGGSSNWVSFGGNGEDESDFGIDVTSPTAPSLTAPQDSSFTRTTETTFTWGSVADTGSGVDYYELTLATSTVFGTITFSSQTVLTTSTATGLAENPYWWKLRVRDNAGNTGVYSSTRSFIVDLSSPTIQDNQNGDTTWRKSNNSTYTVGFQDTGGSHLDRFQVRASTNSSGSGPFLTEWTQVSSLSGDSYSTPWQLPAAVWNVLMTDNIYTLSILSF